MHTLRYITVILFSVLCFSLLSANPCQILAREAILTIPENLNTNDTIHSIRSANTEKSTWFLSDICAEKAYASITSLPTKDTIVAVIDTGVDYTHEALSNALWTNEAEKNGIDGIDDDNNGYVDDIYGYNFFADNSDPMDNSTGNIEGHGTHIAHTILQTAGATEAGNPFRIRIMALKAGDSYGNFSSSDVIRAVEYACANGASVINLSISTQKNNSSLKEALLAASNTAIIVAASGNNGLPTSESLYSQCGDYYPASHPFVAGIMSHTENNTLASFSNWDYKKNTHTDYECSAPGEDIYAAVPGNMYKTMSGTSMSTAVASGAASLLWVKYGNIPNISAPLLTARLMHTGKDTVTCTDLYGQSHSFHKLNLYELLTENFFPELLLSSVEYASEENKYMLSLKNLQGLANDISASVSFPDYPDIAPLTEKKESLPVFTTDTLSFSLPDKLTSEDTLSLSITLSYKNGLQADDTYIYTNTYTMSLHPDSDIQPVPEISVPLKGITLPVSPMLMTVSSDAKLIIGFLPENTTTDRTLSYTSSAPSIVSVDSSGHVYAHNSGQALLTITTSNGLQATLKIIVTNLPNNTTISPSEPVTAPSTTDNMTGSTNTKLQTPYITSVKKKETAKKTALRIRWTKSLNANAYVVYRKKKKTGEWKKIKTVSSDKIYWIDNKIQKGILYYYKIQALGNTAAINSDFSPTYKTVIPKKISKLRVRYKKKTKKLYITFTKQKNVSGYEVYISSGKKTKKYTIISTQPAIQLKYSCLSKKYHIRIRAFYKNNTQKIYGVFSSKLITKRTS